MEKKSVLQKKKSFCKKKGYIHEESQKIHNYTIIEIPL